MRIVGQQGQTGLCVASWHDPVVAALAFQHAYIQCGGGQHLLCGQSFSLRRGLFGVHTQILIKGCNVDFGAARLTWIRWKKFPQILCVQCLSRHEAGKFIAPVATQIKCHHQCPAHAVNSSPRLHGFRRIDP